jgi:menaquinone-specific isochorismate synthase
VSSANPLPVTRDTVSAFRVGPVLEYAPPSNPLYFRSEGVEIVGLGEHVRWVARGPARFAELAERWRELLSQVEPSMRDSLIALGSGSFDPDDEASLIVPRVTIARRGREVTTITLGSDDASEPNRRSIGHAPVVEWPHIDTVFPDRVRTALGRLDEGFGKVVVARAITGTVVTTGDERAPLARLTSAYPDCHIFAVDGLWGASPETLVRVVHRRVTARVLAGSAARGIDPTSDARAANELMGSAKDRDEHRFAVTSVVSSLEPHCRSIVGADTPFPLRLTNVWHLASDIEGVLAANRSVLELIDSLHPTAAVAGVPRDRALATIRDVEKFPRGRYAGPVGWVDGAGNGEWAIALRCAQWRGDEIVAHAGAGVVVGSDPDSEYRETELKFRPIRDALAAER